MSSSQSPFHSEHPGGYPSLHSLAPPLQTMTTSLGHGLGAAFGLRLLLAIPPDPLFYGSVEGVPRYLRPARCPLERCPFKRRPQAAPKP